MDMGLYKKELVKHIQNKFQRKALATFASSYKQARKNAFSEIDVDELKRKIHKIKSNAIERIEELFEEFKKNAQKKGIHVHFAKDAAEARRIILNIAKENSCKNIVKSKSMTSEEIFLNSYLESNGLEVVETDLGEWIIQLRKEGPSHMVMPAIHLSREDVAKTFSETLNQHIDSSINTLVKVARKNLREKFALADMGLTGANFAIADCATIGIVSNEGNARLVATLPRIHVAIIGIDKLLPSLSDALIILNGLTKNATAQNISTYVSWITGCVETTTNENEKKIFHIVFLDNGRLSLSKDPVFREALYCVRCGACSNICPIYRIVGGHGYGHIYIGAIGLVLTYFYHGINNDRSLVQNCLNCHACKDICIAGIDLPRLIKEIDFVIKKQTKEKRFSKFIAEILKNRTLFHSILKTARYMQFPFKDKEQYIRHLPHILFKGQEYKRLPALSKTPFRDKFFKLKKQIKNPELKVALFTGCLQDFVYPSHLEAALSILQGRNIEVDLPLSQGCCGLPVEMLGYRDISKELALNNLSAIDPSDYDYILTLCASCASHLKNAYPKILREDIGLSVKAIEFSKKIIDFSSFACDVLKIKDVPNKRGLKVSYHFPCHLIRGLGVSSAPKKLIELTKVDYIQHQDEDTCCGFGGTYSLKFPEISKEIIYEKLEAIKKLNPDIIITDCPGCIMQIDGAQKKMELNISVMHMAEFLYAFLK